MDLIEKALNILKKRENYYGDKAHEDDTSYAVQCGNLERACAYNSAWWIVYYALQGDEEALNQFDYLE